MKRALVTIEVNSPIPESECTTYYLVQYKASGDIGWTLLNGTGITTDNEFYIHPLAPATDYLIEVRRSCCNGIVSEPDVYEHTTAA